MKIKDLREAVTTYTLVTLKFRLMSANSKISRMLNDIHEIFTKCSEYKPF